MERVKTILLVVLQLWTGILLIYTFELNPLVGFFVSFMLWWLTTLGGKKKLNKKKLLLIGLLISVSGDYKSDEFIFNALVGMTAFQAISFFAKSEEESRCNWLPIVYVSLVVFYTLRMTLVFDIPEIFASSHEWFLSTEKFLTANPKIMWAISLSLIALNVVIFFKKLQGDSALILGLISGLCGLEDMSVITLMSMVGVTLLKIKNGDDKENECEKPVQQAGKVYKL